VAENQFFSFEEALKELRLKEEELKRLVSEGEIRAFREGDTMKLRRADVENLRNELSGGEVVDLGEVREELVFEDDALADAGMATQEIGMATEEISDIETIVDEGVEDVGVADEVELEQQTITEETVVETTEDDDETIAAPVVTSRVVEAPEEYEGAGMRILVLVTSLVLILAIPVCMAASSGKFSPVATTIAGWFGK
jgi:excisionase family DNA binding protein